MGLGHVFVLQHKMAPLLVVGIASSNTWAGEGPGHASHMLSVQLPFAVTSGGRLVAQQSLKRLRHPRVPGQVGLYATKNWSWLLTGIYHNICPLLDRCRPRRPGHAQAGREEWHCDPNPRRTVMT